MFDENCRIKSIFKYVKYYGTKTKYDFFNKAWSKIINIYIENKDA